MLCSDQSSSGRSGCLRGENEGFASRKGLPAFACPVSVVVIGCSGRALVGVDEGGEGTNEWCQPRKKMQMQIHERRWILAVRDFVGFC